MAARFPWGKQPKFPVHHIGTRKLSNLNSPSSNWNNLVSELNEVIGIIIIEFDDHPEQCRPVLQILQRSGRHFLRYHSQQKDRNAHMHTYTHTLDSGSILTFHPKIYHSLCHGSPNGSLQKKAAVTTESYP